MSRQNRTEAVKWYATPDDYLKHRNHCLSLGISQSQGIQEGMRHWWNVTNGNCRRAPANRPRAGLQRVQHLPGSRAGRGGAPMPRYLV